MPACSLPGVEIPSLNHVPPVIFFLYPPVDTIFRIANAIHRIPTASSPAAQFPRTKVHTQRLLSTFASRRWITVRHPVPRQGRGAVGVVGRAGGLLAGGCGASSLLLISTGSQKTPGPGWGSVTVSSWTSWISGAWYARGTFRELVMTVICASKGGDSERHPSNLIVTQTVPSGQDFLRRKPLTSEDTPSIRNCSDRLAPPVKRPS